MYRRKDSMRYHSVYRHRGYDIIRRNSGTVDDWLTAGVMGRWYVDQADDNVPYSPSGSGFASLAEAVSHIDRAFDSRADLRGAGTPQRHALNYDTLRIAGRRNREIDDGGLS